MLKSVTELDREANHLPKKDRTRLAYHLIASLDPGEEVDAEAVWLDEAERRHQAYRQGHLDA